MVNTKFSVYKYKCNIECLLKECRCYVTRLALVIDRWTVGHNGNNNNNNKFLNEIEDHKDSYIIYIQ